MKVLQKTRKSYESLGLSPNPELFNRETHRTLVIFLSATIAQWIFLLHEADNSRTFMESIYVIICYHNTYISFACIVLNKGKLFALIDNIDKIVDESKWLKLKSFKIFNHIDSGYKIYNIQN